MRSWGDEGFEWFEGLGFGGDGLGLLFGSGCCEA